MIKLKDVIIDLATVDCKQCGKTVSLFKIGSHLRKEHNEKLTKNDKKLIAKRMVKLFTFPFALVFGLLVLLFGILAETFNALYEILLTILGYWY